MTKIFGIRNKATGEFVVYNSKCAWTKRGNAKNAWALHQSRWECYNGEMGFTAPRFDDQDEYEIVDLLEIVAMYEGLCK